MSEEDTDDTRSGPPMFNIVASILLATISIWLLNVTIPNNIGQAAGKGDITPALFPSLTVWLLLCLSVALFVVSAAKLRVQGWDRDNNGVWVFVQFVVWMTAAALVYIGLQTIGYLVMAAVLIGLTVLACGYRNYWMIGVVAVVTPLITSQLAWHIFQVQLP